MSEQEQRYQDALWQVIGACRQAAVTPDRWERACRLAEAYAAAALGVPSLLANEQHHPAPDFTLEERALNERWHRESAGEQQEGQTDG